MTRACQNFKLAGVSFNGLQRYLQVKQKDKATTVVPRVMHAGVQNNLARRRVERRRAVYIGLLACKTIGEGQVYFTVSCIVIHLILVKFMWRLNPSNEVVRPFCPGGHH